MRNLNLLNKALSLSLIIFTLISLHNLKQAHYEKIYHEAENIITIGMFEEHNDSNQTIKSMYEFLLSDPKVGPIISNKSWNELSEAEKKYICNFLGIFDKSSIVLLCNDLKRFISRYIFSQVLSEFLSSIFDFIISIQSLEDVILITLFTISILALMCFIDNILNSPNMYCAGHVTIGNSCFPVIIFHSIYFHSPWGEPISKYTVKRSDKTIYKAVFRFAFKTKIVFILMPSAIFKYRIRRRLFNFFLINP